MKYGKPELTSYAQIIGELAIANRYKDKRNGCVNGYFENYVKKNTPVKVELTPEQVAAYENRPLNPSEFDGIRKSALVKKYDMRDDFVKRLPSYVLLSKAPSFWEDLWEFSRNTVKGHATYSYESGSANTKRLNVGLAINNDQYLTKDGYYSSGGTALVNNEMINSDRNYEILFQYNPFLSNERFTLGWESSETQEGYSLVIKENAAHLERYFDSDGNPQFPRYISFEFHGGDEMIGSEEVKIPRKTQLKLSSGKYKFQDLFEIKIRKYGNNFHIWLSDGTGSNANPLLYVKIDRRKLKKYTGSQIQFGCYKRGSFIRDINVIYSEIRL